MFRPSLATWFGLPYQAHVGALVVTAVAGVGLLMLATGLRRRKRRAWQLAVFLTALISVLQLVFRHAVVAAAGDDRAVRGAGQVPQASSPRGPTR